MSPPNIRNAVKAFRQILRDAADHHGGVRSRNAATAFRQKLPML
jgi:hypothetical protein